VSKRSGVDSSAAIGKWRLHLKATGKSQDTVRLYSTGVRRFLDEVVCDHPSTATPEHLDTFLASIGTKGAARQKYLHGIRTAWVFWTVRRIVPRDITEGYRVKKARARPKVRLSEEELTRLVYAAACRDERRGWALLLTFGTGMRRMETAGLRPLDIQGDGALIHGKGGKSRWIPLGPLAKAALEGLEPSYNGTVLGGIKRATVTSWAKQAAIDADLREKVRGRTSHIFRAAFAQYLLNRGTPVHVVRDLMGHESIATTNEYAVSDEEQQIEAVAGH
jgi:integrase/recombinase XerD